jgi:hypothetical protein
MMPIVGVLRFGPASNSSPATIVQALIASPVVALQMSGFAAMYDKQGVLQALELLYQQATSDDDYQLRWLMSQFDVRYHIMLTSAEVNAIALTHPMAAIGHEVASEQLSLLIDPQLSHAWFFAVTANWLRRTLADNGNFEGFMETYLKLPDVVRKLHRIHSYLENRHPGNAGSMLASIMVVQIRAIYYLVSESLDRLQQCMHAADSACFTGYWQASRQDYSHRGVFPF